MVGGGQRVEVSLRVYCCGVVCSKYLQDDFHVAVRGIIVAENRQVADDFEALAIHGYQNHRLLLVGGSRWIRPSLCGYELCVVRAVLYVSESESESVTMRIIILQRGSPAPEVHHFLPLMTYSSPSL